MAIEIKEIKGETKPVKVSETPEGKPVYCHCCQSHKELKMAALRGSAYELRGVLPQWFAGLGIKEIVSHAQSESEGNLTVSIVYH